MSTFFPCGALHLSGIIYIYPATENMRAGSDIAKMHVQCIATSESGVVGLRLNLLISQGLLFLA